MRSGLAALALSAVLAGCTGFGVGFAELPSIDGWEPLPVGNWLLEGGTRPERVVYCPPSRCARPAVAMLISAEGEQARALVANLADSAQLAARPPRSPPAKVRATGRAKKQVAAPAKPAAPKIRAATAITRGTLDGAALTEISLTPDRPEGHAAHVAVLSWRGEAKEHFALAVTTEAGAARGFARAAMRSWR